MSRKVTVVSTQGDDRVILETSAENWGNLKSDLQDEGTFNPDNDLKPMIKGLRLKLTANEDVLPEGDFTLFLTPSKIKSGH